MPDMQAQPLGRPIRSCPEFLDAHSDYLDGLVPDQEIRWLDAHAASCSSCRSYDSIVRRGLLLARNLPEIEPSSHFHDKLQARIMGLDTELARPMVASGATAVVIAAVLLLIALVPLIRLMDDLNAGGPAAASGAMPRDLGTFSVPVSGAMLVRAPGNSNFTPVVVQPPALQQAPSAPRLIAYPLLQSTDR